MELHTLGVDGGYTQKDVQEVARCFTGWTIFAPRGAAQRSEMGAQDDAPDSSTSTRACTTTARRPCSATRFRRAAAVKDGLMVLDILARHPSTAKFIATKLARRFVSDDPTPRWSIASPRPSQRATATYARRCARSSLRRNSTRRRAYRAKIKTPFELAVSAIRTLGGETNGGPALHQWIARMGEPLYGIKRRRATRTRPRTGSTRARCSNV